MFWRKRPKKPHIFLIPYGNEMLWGYKPSSNRSLDKQAGHFCYMRNKREGRYGHQ